MNLASLLSRAGRIARDAGALAHGSRDVATFGELEASVAALAGGLLARGGLVWGDRVAILMKNSPDYVAALFACWRAGLVAVPVNAKLHAQEVAFVLADSGARLLVAGAGLESVASEAIAAAGTAARLVVTGDAEWRALGRASPALARACAPDDAAWLFYTSGTTGRPKGAVLTHGNLLAMTAAFFIDVDPVEPGDALLHAAPMSHGSGLYILPFVAGLGRQVIPESGGFEPDEVFSLMRTHPRLSLFAAPTMVGRLVRAPAAGADTGSLKTIVYGGGPMYVADCKAALALFGPKLAQIYGQGESPMTITVLPKRLHAQAHHPRYEQRLASVGYPQSVVEVIAADEAGRPLPAGEAGEVLVRGATVMRGYWNNPAASAETLRGGWLHTGDVGAFDDEGFLTLKDRSKDVIISGGSNIYPREVEEVLLRHPGVREVSVVGRPHPDWGEEVVAFVVADEGVTGATLDRLCVEHIARFKRPKTYCFLPDLPKNSYGKVLKTQLRERAASATR